MPTGSDAKKLSDEAVLTDQERAWVEEFRRDTLRIVNHPVKGTTRKGSAPPPAPVANDAKVGAR